VSLIIVLLLYLFLLCPISDPRWFFFSPVYFRNMLPRGDKTFVRNVLVVV
jgi:hypothetical protein